MKNVLLRNSIIIISLFCFSSILTAAPVKATTAHATDGSDSQFVVGATNCYLLGTQLDTGYVGLHSEDFDLRAGLAFPISNYQLLTLMGFGHIKLTKTENMLYGLKLIFISGTSSSQLYCLDLGIQHQLSEKLLLEMTWSPYVGSLNSSSTGIIGSVTSFYLTYIL